MCEGHLCEDGTAVGDDVAHAFPAVHHELIPHTRRASARLSAEALRTELRQLGVVEAGVAGRDSSGPGALGVVGGLRAFGPAVALRANHSAIVCRTSPLLARPRGIHR